MVEKRGKERAQEEVGATSGRSHEQVVEQTVGRDRALRNLSKEPPAGDTS